MTRLLVLCGLTISLLAGCAENPGSWGADKVQQQIGKSLELTDVTLNPREEGGFEGSGKRGDGETVSFTITQDPDAHRMSWSAEGDRGLFEDGFYELK